MLHARWPSLALLATAAAMRVTRRAALASGGGVALPLSAQAMQPQRAALVGGNAVSLPLAAKALEPLPVRYGSGDDQFADCYLQDGQRPVVVLLHGGYWRASYGKSLMDAVARDVRTNTEFHCLNVEYARGAGSCERASADVAAALAWLAGPAARRLGLDATNRAAKESEIPNFKGSYLGRFPIVSADFWTSDHLSERSRSVDAFSGTRARGTLTLKRR